MKSYMSDHSLRFAFNGIASTSVPVMSGIPQSSVFGVTLHIIFINDLPESVESSSKLFSGNTK